MQRKDHHNGRQRLHQPPSSMTKVRPVAGRTPADTACQTGGQPERSFSSCNLCCLKVALSGRGNEIVSMGLMQKTPGKPAPSQKTPVGLLQKNPPQLAPLQKTPVTV